MATANWTWLIYMATHNDVAEAGNQSVARMRLAQRNDSVRVLVQQATPDDCVRRIIGANPEVVADLGQIDSGDPAALVDFIQWGADTAPAQHYALVLWSHGSGWEPSEMDAIAKQQPALVPVTTSELHQRGAGEGRQVFFSTTLRTLLSLPTPPVRAVAFDDGSGHSLDTIELGKVTDKVAQILGQPIDLLGMNACLMSAIEVAYQLRLSVRVYVASEDLMPAQGLPYDDILNRLKAQPAMDAVTLGKLLVERYCAYLLASSPQTPLTATLTALQLDGIERVATAVSAFASALQADIGGEIKEVWDAHRAAHPFLFRLYDLVNFCQELAAQSSAGPNSIAAAQAVLTALKDPAFLLSINYTAQTYKDTGGVSTYLMPPIPGKTLSPYYAQTAYAQATGWDKFLAAYHAAIP